MHYTFSSFARRCGYLLIIGLFILGAPLPSFAQSQTTGIQSINDLRDRLPQRVLSRFGPTTYQPRSALGTQGTATQVRNFRAQEKAFLNRLNARIKKSRDIMQPAPSSANVSANEQDSLALVVLYNETNGDVFWNDNSNWLSGPVSTWAGVSLNQDGRVTGLDLNNNTLLGSLPIELADLTLLEILDLSNNALSGTIPSELGNLVNLEQLNLSQNLLSGDIPTTLGDLVNLKTLFLWQNRLTGEIPEVLGNLISLEDLWLFSNELSGVIPSSLGNLFDLFSLALDLNELTGEIPESLSQLNNLIELSLDNNFLTGGIPPELVNLQNLQALFLGGNPLGGNFPVELSGLPILQVLSIPDAGLDGALPEDLGAFRFLTSLDLSNNDLSGGLPESMLGMINLSELNLSGNSLTGPLWPMLGFSPFQPLDLLLSENLLSGEIPASISNITQLRTLDLSSNDFSGELPRLTLNEKIRWLYLNNNNFSGELNGQLDRQFIIIELDLSNNDFTGELDNVLGQHPFLEAIWLESNNFSGPIPEKFSELTRLQAIFFFDNALSGEIPSFIGNLTDLVLLDLGLNNFSGTLPTNLSELAGLRFLLLDGNQFMGAIPARFANLTELERFTIAVNNFNALPDLSRLPFLNQVEVAENQLTFEDVEPLEDLAAETLVYAPQQDFLPVIDDLGNTTRYRAGIGGTANQYQWFVDNTAVNGETGPEFIIDNASNLGDSIYVEVSNSLAPALILYSIPTFSDATLSRIMVLPDTGFVATGDTIQFVVEGYDQFDQARSFTPTWTTSGGSIDEDGMFIAGATTGAFEVSAENVLGTLSGSATIVIEDSNQPTNLESTPTTPTRIQSSNYPNPFGHETTITFDLPTSSHVKISLFDLLGREIQTVLDGHQSAGDHTVKIELKQWPAGVYFYRLETDKHVIVQKMTKR